MKTEIVAGQTYGGLTAIQKLPEKLYKEEAWLCICNHCGAETKAAKSQLIWGRKKSCGCLRRKSPPNVIDMTGMVINGIKVIERAGKTARDNATWLCLCHCGKTFEAAGTQLRRGEIVSCGCARQEQIKAAKKGLAEKTVDGVQLPLLTKKVRSDSGTGHKGVHRRIRRGKETYEAYITVKGRRIYAKPEKTLEAAIAARKRMEEIYHQPYLEQGGFTMATKSTSVNLQPAIIAELDKRGQRSPVINRDLERLYSLYARALRRANLTVEEACLIVDVTNGSLYDVRSAGLLWGSVQDSIELDGLDAKWNVDGKALVDKLAALDEFTCMAIIDAAERFWNDERNHTSDFVQCVKEVFGIA